MVGNLLGSVKYIVDLQRGGYYPMLAGRPCGVKAVVHQPFRARWLYCVQGFSQHVLNEYTVTTLRKVWRNGYSRR